ncbi:hypothetical protein AB3N59_14900 [Leptospira sp. WS92.C1]
MRIVLNQNFIQDHPSREKTMYSKIIILVFFLTQFSACASMYVKEYETQPGIYTAHTTYYQSRPGAYLASRVKDFAEIFTLTINTNEYGARAIVGPLSLGLHMQTDKNAGRIPNINISSFGLQGGLIGPKNSSELTILFLTIGDISLASGKYGYQLNRVKQSHYLPFKVKGEAGSSHLKSFEYTRLGVSAGLYLGLRAEVNPGELLDFLLGFLGVDIYDDDFEIANRHYKDIVKKRAMFEFSCSEDKIKVLSYDEEKGIYNVIACGQKVNYHCSEVGDYQRFTECIRKD